MAEKTLEEFISEYVSNKAKENTRESYESWLRKNGVNTEKIYTDTVRDIETDYKRALPTYGNKAESISDLGLTESGYSDYISGKAYAEMQKRKQRAKETYVQNEEKNAAGYQSYLKEQNDLIIDVAKAMSNEGIADYETAYRYAVNLGLGERDATAAAKFANDYVAKKLRKSILTTVMAKGFGKTQAYEYALGLGLSEDDAELIGEYADKISKYYPED